MTRDDLVSAVETASGATITAMTGAHDGIVITLSDNRTIKAERRRVKAAKTADELRAYVEGLI